MFEKTVYSNLDIFSIKTNAEALWQVHLKQYPYLETFVSVASVNPMVKNGIDPHVVITDQVCLEHIKEGLVLFYQFFGNVLADAILAADPVSVVTVMASTAYNTNPELCLSGIDVQTSVLMSVLMHMACALSYKDPLRAIYPIVSALPMDPPYLIDLLAGLSQRLHHHLVATH